MTEFRALPIRRGDAFLIRSTRGDYLIDGGVPGCGLTDLLTERKVRKLRAAVCTNMCTERIGGILELMESGYAVSEYWLPASIDRLLTCARFFNGDWDTWLHLIQGEGCKTPATSIAEGWDEQRPPSRSQRERDRLGDTATLLGLGVSACLGWSPYGHLSPEIFSGADSSQFPGLIPFFDSTLAVLSSRIEERNHRADARVGSLLRDAGISLFAGGGPDELALQCGRLLLAEAQQLPGGPERGQRAVVTTLALGTMAGALLSRTKSTVRFHTPTGRLENLLVPHHPIRCVNGAPLETHARIPDSLKPDEILREVKQATGYRDGLVYQFGNAGCSVLFCGDSRLAFLARDERLRIDRPTVVVSPRQGSPSAERAYDRILSTRPGQDVWIRTHLSYAHKVSTYFKTKPNKHCLTHCRDYSLQEILLRCEQDKWATVSGGGCICQ